MVNYPIWRIPEPMPFQISQNCLLPFPSS